MLIQVKCQKNKDFIPKNSIVFKSVKNKVKVKRLPLSLSKRGTL